MTCGNELWKRKQIAEIKKRDAEKKCLICGALRTECVC